MPHMKQTATRRTRRAAKQPRTILAEYVYSPHDPKTTVRENLNDWELFQHYENVYVRIVSFFLELKNISHQRARCKENPGKDSAAPLLQAANNSYSNNLVCYLEIIDKYIVFKKKCTHRDFFTSQDPRPLALHTRWIGRVLGIISICYDSGGVSRE